VKRKLPRNPPEPEELGFDFDGQPWRSKTEIVPSDQCPEIGHRATKIHAELQMPNLRSQGSLYFHSKKEQTRCLDDFAYVVMPFGPKSSGKLRVQQHQPV
jgi:hypothetical protein